MLDFIRKIPDEDKAAILATMQEIRPSRSCGLGCGVAPGPEPVKARPPGRPKGRGLTARTLTEPGPSAESSPMSAGTYPCRHGSH